MNACAFLTVLHFCVRVVICLSLTVRHQEKWSVGVMAGVGWEVGVGRERREAGGAAEGGYRATSRGGSHLRGCNGLLCSSVSVLLECSL